MPTITFAAPIVRKAIATLEAELPTQVALFNAEPDNAVSLAEPTEVVFGAMDPLILAGPVVEVSATDGSFGAGALERADVDHDVTVNVVVWHEGEKGELSPTYAMSLGMARCVIEALWKTSAFGDEVEISNDAGAITWRTEVLPADPTEDGREFRKWRVPVLITFRLEAVERF